MHWCDVLHFNHTELARLPGFEPRRLARRATHFFHLGLSLPAALDLNAGSPLDYLRALHALLAEFDAYQQLHPPDGAASSLSRARIPQMFKRGPSAAKMRRTSSAADIGLPMGPSAGGGDPSAETNKPPPSGGAAGGAASSAAASLVAFASSEQELLPGEEYAHLLTPSLPFDPDFFEVFATLCDVLIDCYGRITALVASPADCLPGVAETFAKADAKLRKVVVAPIVTEFGDTTRMGTKGEVTGGAKVVLGGLM